MNESRLSCLRTFDKPQHAHMASAILREHEISCSVTGDALSSSLSWYGLAARQTKLMVMEEDVPRSLELLDQEFTIESEFDWMDNGTSGRFNWLCDNCAEVNADTFDVCWACRQVKPPDPELCPVEKPVVEIVSQRTELSYAPRTDSPYSPPAPIASQVPLTPQHGLVSRVTIGTLFAFWFPPFSIYNYVMLYQVFQRGRPPMRVYLALMANTLCFGLLAFYVSMFLVRW